MPDKIITVDKAAEVDVFGEEKVPFLGKPNFRNMLEATEAIDRAINILS
jgi:hypothetical protein